MTTKTVGFTPTCDCGWVGLQFKTAEIAEHNKRHDCPIDDGTAPKHSVIVSYDPVGWDRL